MTNGPATNGTATIGTVTNGSAPSPAPQPHKNDAEYARKLALAILSTLESKGLLSKMDVEAILHVAHRTAMTSRPAHEDTPVSDGPAQEKEAAEGAAPSVLTAPVAVKRPLGPAVLGTRWVKPDAGVTDAVRDAAAEVATGHEPGAVKVTGQATKAKDRPLAPAILTDLQRKTASSPAAPAEPMLTNSPELSESEVKAQVESNLKAIESKAQAQQEQAHQEQEQQAKGAAETAEAHGETGKPKKEGEALPVIDFDLE